MEHTYPLDKIAEILSKYCICSECLGRQFAVLGKDFSNTERAKSMLNTLIMCNHSVILETNESNKEEIHENAIELLKNIASNTNDFSAHLILDEFGIIYKDHKNDFECFLCNNLFLNIDNLIKDITNRLELYEFDSFLIGTMIEPRILEKEDEFRARLGITTGESFKKNINRVVGIRLGEIWNKEVSFMEPEINLVIRLKNKGYDLEIRSNPLCIKGRYHKYERGIPQTHWPHRECRGRGCEGCNYTGKQWETSVEELISPYFLKFSEGTNSKFHGAGREDIDARCLGTGRPFVIEIKNPVKRNLDLKVIEDQIKEDVGQRVDVVELEIVSRDMIKKIKEKGEETHKIYEAFVETDQNMTEVIFKEKLKELLEKVVGPTIYQRTPTRVIHRRADLTREKKVYSIEGKWVDETHMRFQIDAMGGTYIKELISGDDGRTSPSFSQIFNVQMICIELDVLAVEKI